MATVNVNGVELYYRIEGNGEKVAMTHGGWTDAETWQAVTPLLADRFQVVVWDRRGHSRSQAGTRDGYRQDARDLIALLEVLGGEPAHLVGNSSGGSVILNATAFRPDLVRTAAVHEPAVMGLVQDEDELSRAERATEERVKELIRNGEPREAARHFIEELGIGLPGWDALPVELHDTMTRNASTVPSDIDEGYQVEAVDWSGLARAEVPVLVTYGTDSSETMRRSAVSAAERAGGAAVEIQGAGHIPHRTHPEAYARALTDFFVRSSPVGRVSVSRRRRGRIPPSPAGAGTGP